MGAQFPKKGKELINLDSNARNHFQIFRLRQEPVTHFHLVEYPYFLNSTLFKEIEVWLRNAWTMIWYFLIFLYFMIKSAKNIPHWSGFFLCLHYSYLSFFRFFTVFFGFHGWPHELFRQWNFNKSKTKKGHGNNQPHKKDKLRQKVATGTHTQCSWETNNKIC